MKWEFQTDRPIYTQIIEQIKLRIVSGEYPRGAKLASVRDLAAEAGVNPNTMQRALADLERDGLVFSQRTSGRFITEDQEMLKTAKSELAQSLTEQFLKSMAQIGFTQTEVMEMLAEKRGSQQ